MTSTELLPSNPASIEFGLAGVVDRRIAGEHRLDVVGIVEIDDGSHRGDADGEHLAVAPAAGRHEAAANAEHQRGLDHAGQWRARRQVLAHWPSLGGWAMGRWRRG